MEITAALAADLTILSEALDATDADVTEALRQLVADVRLAVRSYLGLTVTSDNARFPLILTVMEDAVSPVDVVSSLMMPLSDERADADGARLSLILYAAKLGAFVDLAADLSWLTDRRLADFVLDRHLGLPAEPVPDSGVRTLSLINQAIGVLLGRGYTPEQAQSEIDARAAAAGHSRFDAAYIILGEPPRDDVDRTDDGR